MAKRLKKVIGPDPTVRYGVTDEGYLATMSTVTEGMDLRGLEVAEVKDCGDEYEVETLYSPAPKSGTGGPAMVNSEGFRSGWDRVFGKEAN